MLKRKNTILQLGQFLALVASLLIAGQIGYTFYQGAPLCLNDGCKVVEKLTRVSPLVINVVGLLFFQMVYWGLHAARGEQRRVPSLIKNILLAGLAAEGVLVSFQYLVAQTFCSYCIGIFLFVVLLNLLLGVRQMVAGVLICAAATLSFASLDVSKSLPGRQAFTAGVFAQRLGVLKSPEHYLFFSSTCLHCEKVIAALKTNTKATVSFNPIDKVDAIDVPQVSYRPAHSIALNKALLSSLGINEIPVLMTKTPEGLMIRQGEAAILSYLTTPPVDVRGQSDPLNIPGSSDSCQVSSDCIDTSSGQSTLQ
ncbi:MAG: hypothetical protein PHI97_01800 [Desulfobulbus sp.]|nr:hypothetical protein [Desulfobulbus sp.]